MVERARVALPAAFGEWPQSIAASVRFVRCRQLEALGFGTQVSRRQTLFWSAAGAELLATFVRVGPLAVGAQGGFFFPFLRNGFYFDDDPSLPVHTIPRIGAAAALTLALRAF